MAAKSFAVWLQEFLSRRGLPTPDGRPLFEYRVTAAEHDQLRRGFTGRFPKSSHGAAAFCLYAAEWWRRHGRGFKWEGLLESLDLLNPYVELYDPIERGLRYWKRELRIGRTAFGVDRTWRDFVGTLSREGGMPLQLLLNAQTSVNRFFKHLLKDRYASGSMSADAAAAAGHFLPEAWQHRDIYDLAARLVTSLWDLREKVKDADDPVAALDRQDRNWRSSLPVLIDSDVAAALVQGLVREAHEIAATGRVAFCVETRLVRTGDGWTLDRLIDPARKMKPDQVKKLLGLGGSESIPRRLRLVVQAADAPLLPLAAITQWELDAPYSVEFLTKAPAVLASVREIRVLAETGSGTLGGALLRGGEALDDVPWIFVAQTTEKQAQAYSLVCQGSAQLRATTALVAVPEGFKVEATSTDAIDQLGTVASPSGQRTLVFIKRGSVRCRECRDGGEVFRVEVASPMDEAWSYHLAGPVLDGLGSIETWRGVPRVVAESPSGLTKNIPMADLEWRPRRSGAPWLRVSAECAGHVDLRYAPGGLTRFCTSARVVPERTTIEFIERGGPNNGGLRIDGSNASRAEVIAADGFRATRDPAGLALEWTLEPVGVPPATVEVELAWSGARSVRLTLPFPLVGTRFIDRAGRVLPDGATIALENLSGCRVEAVVPASEKAPILVAQLRDARDRSTTFVRDSEFWCRLTDRSSSSVARLKRFSLDLHELTEDLRLRLASSTHLNAFVALTVKRGVAAEEANVRVRRFPVALRVNEERDAVVVLPDKSETHVEDTLARIQVGWLPVSDPRAPLTLLQQRAGGWALDPELGEAGTWLIAGYVEATCCARPVIWARPRIEGVMEAIPRATTLEHAVEVPQTSLRMLAFADLLGRMVSTPNHPEWTHLLPYVQTLRSLPATTFDLLDAMVQVPESCVFSLIAAQPQLPFQDVWEGFQDLSFSWDTVPIAGWIRGVGIWWERVAAELSSIEDENVVALVRDACLQLYRTSADQILLRLPTFSMIRELVDEKVFSDRVSSLRSPTMMEWMKPGGPGRAYALEQREKACEELRQLHSDRKWPVLNALRDLKNELDERLPHYLLQVQNLPGTFNDWHFSVVMAPVLASLAVAWGIRLSPEHTFAIRQMRAFDISWFQRCQVYSLALAMALILEKNPEHYQ